MKMQCDGCEYKNFEPLSGQVVSDHCYMFRKEQPNCQHHTNPQTSEADVRLNNLLSDIKSQHIRNMIKDAVDDL